MRCCFRQTRTSVFLWLGLLLVALSGCATLQGSESMAPFDPESPLAKISSSPTGAPTQIYFASFESVWRALQLSLRYPIAINNMDEGVLVTEWVREVDGFRAPHDKGMGRAGVRYRLQVQAIRGKLGERASVKVIIDKEVQRMVDFFSNPVPLSSDRIEEKVLLYRVDRELAIERGLDALL